MDREPARMAEIVGALSYATDLAAGLPLETAVRTCVTAVTIGREFGLTGPALSDVFYTGLLRFVGCTAFAHETAGRYGAGDDQQFLRAMTLADPVNPVDVLKHAVRGIGAGKPLIRRVGAIAALATEPASRRRLASAHCTLAVALAGRLGLPAAVATALGQIYERFDGRGEPAGLRAEEIALPARILHVAWEAEAHRALGGPDAVAAIAARRRGGEFDPAIVDVLQAVLPALLAQAQAPSLWDVFLDREPAPVRTVTAGIDPVAHAFAHVVDVKSPYTIGHSTGVADLARAAAERCGLAEDVRDQLHIAALLHDLGRVSVPNGIWDKPSALNAAERERVRLGAYHTERILAQSPLLAPYARTAGSAYERLDGTGYPKGLTAAALDVPARLLAAADMYHAATEERAHRPGLESGAAADLLAVEVAAGRLDATAVDAVLTVAGQPRTAQRGYPDGLTAREVEVLMLLVRGLTNKSIARRLGISPKTVQHHVAHVFGKTGASSRAAAAVYAVTHDLDTG